MKLAIAHAATPGPKCLTWRADTITWDEMRAWLDDPADQKETCGYVLGTLTGTARRKGEVVSRSALTLDADHASPHLIDLLRDVRGWAAIVHTTYSSTPDAPRYRVIILTDRDMTPAEYRRVAQAVMRWLGAEHFDSTCDQPERFMYRPAAQRPEWFQSWVVDGDPLCVDDVLKDAERTAQDAEPAPATAVTPQPSQDVPEDVVAAAVARACADLDALAALSDGERLPWTGVSDGVGWDRGTYFVAQRLVQAANSGTAYTLDAAQTDFMAHAPAAAGTYSPEHKWKTAVAHVGSTSLPYDSPAEVFGAVPTGEASPSPTRLATIFPAADLGALVGAERPPRQWVVHGLLPAGASVSLVAPAGLGKSLMALALSLAVAQGEPEFAGLTIPRPRRVLYADMENTPDDVAERLEALGVRPGDDLSRLTYLSLPPFKAFDTEDGGRELGAVLDMYLIGAGDLVVLDSLQRVINGPENDADTMRAYYRHTAMPLKARGATVLRLDNSGKDVARGARGSSSKRDDVDVELLLAPGKDPDLFVVTPGKVRIPDIRALELERTLDDDGRLRFATATDPYQVAVRECLAALAELDVPTGHGWRPASDALKKAGHTFTREIVRNAVRVRKDFGGAR